HAATTAPGSKLSGQSRSRSGTDRSATARRLSRIELVALGDVVRRGRLEIRTGRLGGAAMLFAALLLAACTASPSALGPQATASLSGKTAEAPMPADVLREHQRILAAYGGIYVEARLQSLLERTVERLVGASQKPDLHYKV